MKKMLMVASVASMIEQFNMSNIKLLIQQGYEVHVAANFKNGNTSTSSQIESLKEFLSGIGVTHFNIDFSRNILDVKANLKAYRQILELTEKNNYSFVHCHSPIGGAVARIAAHRAKIKSIYTAHGFHFYKGSPIKSWLLFYPVEKLLSKYTDILITINKEDYQIAKKKFHANKVVYIPGVGIKTNKFSDVEINYLQKRDELGIQNNSFTILSIGELNKNKNHEIIIKALAELNDPNILYLICGQGQLEPNLKKIANDLGIGKQVKFLGYRSDIPEIAKASDVFCFPSYREGLSMALMEAMAAKLPVVCSNIRGNRDLIDESYGGYLINPSDSIGFRKALLKVIKCTDQDRKLMGVYNHNKLISNFDEQIVNGIMTSIYKEM